MDTPIRRKESDVTLDISARAIGVTLDEVKKLVEGRPPCVPCGGSGEITREPFEFGPSLSRCYACDGSGLRFTEGEQIQAGQRRLEERRRELGLPVQQKPSNS